MSNPGWVYVLHFRKKIHHARHYVGSTHCLQSRLKAHANGYGSRLCRAARAGRVGWALGGLYLAQSHAQLRRLERHLKDQHDAGPYCGLCAEHAQRVLPGATIYDPMALTIGTDSSQFERLNVADVPTIRIADHGDSEAILRLMSKERHAVGFIPCGGEGGLEVLIRQDRVVVGTVCHAPVAYCAWTHTWDRKVARVQQIAVDDRVRLMGTARNMLSQVAQAAEVHGVEELVAHVREDLPAVAFWEAMGFAKTGAFRNPKGSKMFIYRSDTDAITKDV